MMRFPHAVFLPTLRSGVFALALSGLGLGMTSGPVQAQVTAFKQAIAESASSDGGVAAFYRENNYQPIWTGAGDLDRSRRAALLTALGSMTVHGLPDRSVEVARLTELMQNARTTRDFGMVEVALSQALVDYANDIQTGFLVPSQIDDGMVRQKPKTNGTDFLTGMRDGQPTSFIRSLAPKSSQYRALMKEKLRLEALMQQGGWGASVPNRKIEPGQSGPDIVLLRNRLISMGYMQRSATRDYDETLEAAVLQFQAEHGLETDGVAGKGTVAEINKSVRDRLKSVIVAMERERWLPTERGERHILVNQTDFTAKIIDHGNVTFETRSVIGKDQRDRRSPEFSDVMEHLVINPSWHVPRSIVTKEYLPKLKANPNAASHIEITDSRGRKVDRNAVDFTQFTARNFPFAMRQPPSGRNALGLVKFIFPNKYNIYLHDTPAKNLFAREVRAYSHGCIRLAQPFEFAYALLARQSEEPKAFFHRVLNSGQETKVLLEQQVPVHIIYRTAVVSSKGRAEFRRDVYGRDAKVWAALERAGVVLSSVQG